MIFGRFPSPLFSSYSSTQIWFDLSSIFVTISSSVRFSRVLAFRCLFSSNKPRGKEDSISEAKQQELQEDVEETHTNREKMLVVEREKILSWSRLLVVEKRRKRREKGGKNWISLFTRLKGNQRRRQVFQSVWSDLSPQSIFHFFPRDSYKSIIVQSSSVFMTFRLVSFIISWVPFVTSKGEKIYTFCQNWSICNKLLLKTLWRKRLNLFFLSLFGQEMPFPFVSKW